MNLISTMTELASNVNVTHLLVLYVICVAVVVIKLYWGSRS